MVFGNGRHEPAPNLLFINGNRTDLWFPPRPLGNSATYGVALADLNGDKHLDLVEVNDAGFLHVVWLNDGRGNLSAEDFFGRADDARGLAVGDLTGDGFPEIVVANRRDERGDAANVVNINDRTGHFRDRRPLPGTGSFVRVALGDLNGDGHRDIVAAGISGSANYLWLNDGEGGFPRAMAVGGPSSLRDSADIAIGDFDRDGYSDVVLVNTDQPGRVLFGDGKGGFSRTVTFAAPAATRVYALAIGDIDGDGHLDVVVGYAGREFIVEESGGRTLFLNQLRDEPNRVYLNDGKGVLSAGPGFGLGNVTRAIALGDVDGDGRLDIAVGTNCGENVIYFNRRLIDGSRK